MSECLLSLLAIRRRIINPQLYTQPLSDYNIDDLSQKDGLLERIPQLSLDLPDNYIIQTLHDTIEISERFWKDTNEFNLKNKRLKNAQMIEGKHLQENKLYSYQTPYVDNELYVAKDAIIAYVTASTPKSEVYPASDSDEDKILATDLEKYQQAYAEMIDLPQKLEGVASNMVSKYVGFLKLRWDPDAGDIGEIITEVVDPNHIIIDKNAKLGENPRFICHVLKASVEELCAKFPDKEEEILQLFSIKRKGAKNMSAEIAYREVWFTYFDKKNQPCEAVAWYVNRVVLDKTKNINWLYEGEANNFLTIPMKPFIPFNSDNDGSHWIDKTSALEQATPLQEINNKLGRQIIDNLATANGFKAIDAKFMTKDDVQNFTGDPNQSLVGNVPMGKSIDQVIKQFTPQMVSNQLITYQTAVIQSIHNVMATPSQFRGDDEGLQKTATTNQMIKNQASGRQDKFVRAIDRGLDRYFKFLTQMMLVWYDSKHYVTVNGGDGQFDFIEMHKSKIKSGMSVSVRSGTTLPFDKERQEAVAQSAAELGLLAPYDYYNLMHMENPQKLYDNMVKWKSNPEQLAMDVDNNSADEKAVVDYTELMAGHKPEPRQDPTPEYINQFRKLMISDEFLNAKKSLQNTVIKFVKKAVESLSLRTELDKMSAPPEAAPMPPAVQATIPPQPPQEMMPQGIPGQMPQMPGQPMGQPPMPAPMAPSAPASPIQGIMQGQPQPPIGNPPAF